MFLLRIHDGLVIATSGILRKDKEPSVDMVSHLPDDRLTVITPLLNKLGGDTVVEA